MMTEDDRLAFSRRLASKTEQNSVRHRKYRLSEKSREAWVGSGEKGYPIHASLVFHSVIVALYLLSQFFAHWLLEQAVGGLTD